MGNGLTQAQVQNYHGLNTGEAGILASYSLQCSSLRRGDANISFFISPAEAREAVNTGVWPR